MVAVRHEIQSIQNLAGFAVFRTRKLQNEQVQHDLNQTCE